MLLINPLKHDRVYADPKTAEMMQKVIDFFEKKGLKEINAAFAEITGFYGITYWYTFQVSMLGLVPVWTGSNEKLKRRTAQLLKEGKVFAFGLSEKEHGADIYSSEMRLTPQGDGRYLGNGRKYYIGNGNEAAITSMFGVRMPPRVPPL